MAFFCNFSSNFNYDINLYYRHLYKYKLHFVLKEDLFEIFCIFHLRSLFKYVLTAVVSSNFRNLFSYLFSSYNVDPDAIAFLSCLSCCEML